MTVPYEVVVAAGGTSRRYGSDKLAVLLGPMLASLPHDAAVVCVGPPRELPGARPVRWTVERPQGSGPLAAVAAGVVETSTDVVVVVGGDMPAVGLAVVSLVDRVAAAETDVAAAVLVDASGRAQPLAAAWRRSALVQRLAALEGDGGLAGRPLRLLVEGVATVEVADVWGAALDVDTRESDGSDS